MSSILAHPRTLFPADSILVKPKPLAETATTHYFADDTNLSYVDFECAVLGEPYMSPAAAAFYTGIDLDDDEQFRNAALLACRNNHASVLRELFRGGLPGDCVDYKNRPLFFHLKATEPFFQDCCLLFEAHGGRLDTVCANGATLLFYCFATPSVTSLPYYLDGPWYTTFVKSNVDFLKTRGLHWTTTDAVGRTALTLVACPVAMRLALKSGALPNTSFASGASLRYLLRKSRECLALLFEYGLNPLAIHYNGVSLLGHAIGHDAVEFLRAAWTFRPQWASQPCTPSGWPSSVAAVMVNSGGTLDLLFSLRLCNYNDKVVVYGSGSEPVTLAVLSARQLRLQCLGVCVRAITDVADLVVLLEELRAQTLLRTFTLSPDLLFHLGEKAHMIQVRCEQIHTASASS